MGSAFSQDYTKKVKNLSVITLNYSGILLSPFEFFSKEKGNKQLAQIEENLSNIFKMILSQQFPEQFNVDKTKNKFKWNLGKIDQKMQKQRYSPVYNASAGIIDDKLISIERFSNQWQKQFDKEVKNIKGLQQVTSQNRQQAMLFDLLCYKTILTHVYQKIIRKGNDFNFTNIQKLNIVPYKKFMQQMFNKSFLDESKKIAKTFQAMDKQNLDIVFVQQANESLIKQLKNKNNQYVLFQKQKSQSIIVCKRSKFNKFYKIDPLQHHPQLKAKLNWNNDTVVAFVDNLILISGHLSSKKQKNPAQMHDMIQSLKALSQMYPMCHIISGCDANAYIYESLQTYFKQNQHSQKKQITQIEKQTQIKKQSQVSSLSTLSKKLSEAKSYIPSSWQIYPKKAQQFTTSKQRTFLQPQVSKAQQVARVCRDYLILVKNQESADIKFEQRKICTIFNKNPEDVPNLPCQQHPYDHYVIKADIAVNVLTNFDK